MLKASIILVCAVACPRAAGYVSPMVALRDASVSFGARTSWWDRAFMPPGSRPEQALHEASLEVAEGCVMAVCGVSGSGKSTLLRLCEGDLAPTAGSVELRCCPCLIDGGVLQRLEGKLKRAGTANRALGGTSDLVRLLDASEADTPWADLSPSARVRAQICLAVEERLTTAGASDP